MKLMEMIGLAVFDIEEGKQVGKVQDFILTNDLTIVGIELEGKSLFSSSVKVVLWNDIIAYGEDAVMIRNQPAICKWEAENIQLTLLLGSSKLKELPVVTNDGVIIGNICDVYFDHDLGNTITGLEISDGFISDLMEGRKWLPFTPDMTKGESAVMVPPLSEERLEKAINSVNG